MEEEKRQKYIAQKDLFLSEKSLLKQEITKHNKAIIDIEQRIDDMRPRIVKGGMLCRKCDCVSMKFAGRTHGGDSTYKCVICEGDNSYR